MGTSSTRPIRSFDGDIAAAYNTAVASSEPLHIPATIFADDRGWSLMNQLQGVMGPEGQVNYSVIYPSVVKAWHRHQRQTDFWLCLMGHIKVGVHRDDGESWLLVIGEMRPGVVIIPPTLWHGLTTIGHKPAGLFYYVTQQYDPENLDEQRRDYDSVEGFPWTVQHK